MGISKTKVQCEKCKKKFRKVKVKKSKHSGKMLCTFCRKNEVTNPFYIPKNKNESIGKYNMTDTEKRLLRTNLMSRGMSFNQAKAIQNSYQRTEDKKRQESFVGGLGQ